MRQFLLYTFIAVAVVLVMGGVLLVANAILDHVTEPDFTSDPTLSRI